MSSFDRILTSRPLNAEAAKVTGRGVHWTPAKTLIRPWDAWQDTPLPTKPVPPEAPRLVGHRVGRLVVVGYGGSRKNGNARWVVRCACGKYGHQTARAIRTRGDRAMCPECDYLSELKAGRGAPGSA